MEDDSKKDFSILFDFNPVLAIELSRIQAGTTNCVLLQQFFEEISISARELMIGNLETRGDFDTKKVEKKVKFRLKSHKEYKFIKRIGCEVIPSAMILNRISKPLMAPEIYYYVCKQDKIKKVQKKLLNLRNLELQALKKTDLLSNSNSVELDEDLTKFIARINRIEGDMLGYPECCVKKFVQARVEHSHHEREIALECLKNEGFKIVLDCFLEPHKVNFTEFPDEFYSFFTSNFYPCSINCENAIDTGKKVEKYLGSFKNSFRAKLVLNVLYQFAICFGSYELIKRNNLDINNEYRKTVLGYFDILDSSLKDILRKTKNLIIYSGNELGNLYIRKVTG